LKRSWYNPKIITKARQALSKNEQKLSEGKKYLPEKQVII